MFPSHDITLTFDYVRYLDLTYGLLQCRLIWTPRNLADCDFFKGVIIILCESPTSRVMGRAMISSLLFGLVISTTSVVMSKDVLRN